MTTMGIDWLKHQEQKRSNLANEQLKSESNKISQQEADTKAYTASFEPQRVEASLRSSFASQSQAETAKGKLDLDRKYRERETAVKETTAQAAMDKNTIAEVANEIKELEVLLKNSTPTIQNTVAAEGLGFSEGVKGTVAVADSITTRLTNLLSSIAKLSLKKTIQ